MVAYTEKFLSRTAKIEDLAIDINNCARAHGWWEDPNRPIEMQRLLFASEVLEAFERFRKAPAETMHQEVAEELVDVLIRLLDAYAHAWQSDSTLTLDFRSESIDLTQQADQVLQVHASLVEINEWAAILVAQLSSESANEMRADSVIVQILDDILCGIYDLKRLDDADFCELVTAATVQAALFCALHDIDLSTILLSKMRKNWGRPHRHGGLRA